MHIRELANEFHISERTVRRDRALLECSYPISSIRGRYYSGVHAAEGWYLNRLFMSERQESLLRRLFPKLALEDQPIMQSILDTFSLPR